ncbi:MAG TPA: pyridoxamine 5'-phosphate oxidase [Acidimicrobiales bacterium]|nr:pyridoxamine 5'-phosphate oxidase [Acidimicrobiales bacterium]
MADRPLGREDLDADPIVQFGSWFAEAKDAVRQPEAIALATVDRAGVPSVRMVLLKGWDERGFVFFTNYASRKGSELAANPHAAFALYWEPLHRQVRVEGGVEPVSETESDRYFATRPRPSQLAAYASQQSQTLAHRAELESAVRHLEAQYAGRDVPRPGHWGGFRLFPTVIEFWQHRENRLHDRFAYRRDGDRWRVDRLAP